MDHMRVIVYHNKDKSFTVALENINTGYQFHLKVIENIYPSLEKNMLNKALEYGRELSKFLKCEMQEQYY